MAERRRADVVRVDLREEGGGGEEEGLGNSVGPFEPKDRDPISITTLSIYDPFGRIF
jgi:hypothetical protein